MSDGMVDPAKDIAELRERVAACESTPHPALARITDLQEQLAALREQNAAMRKALCRVSGMLGHDHWDRTMSHGAGCELCIRQGKIMDDVRAALATKGTAE